VCDVPADVDIVPHRLTDERPDERAHDFSDERPDELAHDFSDDASDELATA
jgi:hypothetical protein